MTPTDFSIQSCPATSARHSGMRNGQDITESRCHGWKRKDTFRDISRLSWLQTRQQGVSEHSALEIRPGVGYFIHAHVEFISRSEIQIQSYQAPLMRRLFTRGIAVNGVSLDARPHPSPPSSRALPRSKSQVHRSVSGTVPCVMPKQYQQQYRLT
jgi:hypothetical protein